MEQKYLLFLLGFEVTLRDRRNGETQSSFIVIPSPEEHPDDLEAANTIIKKYYGGLGYDVTGIKYQESKVKELDLKAEYEAAQSAAEYVG